MRTSLKTRPAILPRVKPAGSALSGKSGVMVSERIRAKAVRTENGIEWLLNKGARSMIPDTRISTTRNRITSSIGIEIGSISASGIVSVLSVGETLQVPVQLSRE